MLGKRQKICSKGCLVRYNILTVLNEGYAQFGRLFINSLFDNIDLDSIDTIYIYDTGLSSNSKKYLSLFPKIKIVDAGFIALSEDIHDKGWQKNTYSKTRFLKEVLVETGIPTIMIDADCVFKCEFIKLLDSNTDLTVCRRTRPGFSNHLGSFFAANNITKSINFLDKWIDRIENSEGKHKESPALSYVLENQNILKIQELDESVISALGDSSDVRIFHLKSDSGLETIERRINQPHLIPYIYRYLGELANV